MLRVLAVTALLVSSACPAPLDVVTPCQPATCAERGAACGAVEDGCGGVLECGGCPEGSGCGINANANQCGLLCRPASCEAGACGMQGDGCGGVITCGTCAAGETCGGGGPNRCGPGACQPRTCAELGASCGAISNGCGATIDCGSCPSGQACGTAQPNQCGAACKPVTCAQVLAQCGTVSDGCGQQLDCGGCQSGLSCGVGGPNRCGVADAGTPVDAGMPPDAGAAVDAGLDPTLVFSATVLSQTEVALAWQPVAGASAYRIERRTTGTPTLVGTPGPAALGLRDTGLTAGTTYTWTLVATVNGAATMPATVTATTLPAPLPGRPEVTGLRFTLVGDDLYISWDAVNLTQEYLVDRGVNGAPLTMLASTGMVSQHVDRNVPRGAMLDYRVRARSPVGTSNGVTGRYVVPPVGSLPSPSLFTAVAATSSTVNLSWIGAVGPSPTTQLRYELERRQGQGAWVPLLARDTGLAQDLGLQPQTTYEYRVRTVAMSYTASPWVTTWATTFSAGAPTCPQTTLPANTFRDARDCEVYRFGTVYGRTWMLENLRFATPRSGFCPLNEPARCQLDGRLYDWAAMHGLPESANTTSVAATVSGICPAGWRLPTLAELTALATAAGGANGGSPLKIGPPRWNGSNTSGFSAVPAGEIWPRGATLTFSFVDANATLWAGSQGSAQNAPYLLIQTVASGAYIQDNYSSTGTYKTYGHSVRCVQ